VDLECGTMRLTLPAASPEIELDPGLDLFPKDELLDDDDDDDVNELLIDSLLATTAQQLVDCNFVNCLVWN
jgi:hypothetical protein